MYWNLHYVSPFYAAPTRLSRQFPINIVSLHTKKENRIQMEEESFQELGRQEHLYKEGNRVGIKINIQRDGNLLSSLAVMSAPQERRKQRENMFGKWQRQVSQPGMKKNGLLEGDNKRKEKLTLQQLCCRGRQDRGEESPVVPEIHICPSQYLRTTHPVKSNML